MHVDTLPHYRGSGKMVYALDYYYTPCLKNRTPTICWNNFTKIYTKK